MQIPLKWVNELINIETVNLEYLIEKLTLGGFEVEEILEIEINNEKTLTLDISATANRSDSLSIQGISLEIAALLNKPPKTSNYLTQNFNWEQNFKNLFSPIIKNSNCSDFIGLTIDNFDNLIVPKWLQQKLISAGLTPENSLLDFQNYILLETGYPFEFYDLDKIKSKLNNSNFNLNLEYSKIKETFVANNNLEYELNNSILVVKANELTISIGGISSTNQFKPSESTKSLLIEASIFNSAKIRQQSRALGIRTDRSSRYEKSLKSTNIIEACYRLISLLRISNPDLSCNLHTAAKSSQPNLKSISLSYKNIKKVLGPFKQSKEKNYIYISPEIISSYLNRLNFEFQYNEQDLIWNVIIPYLRSEDIVKEIDLIEEIGRLHGFNNFLTQLPPIRTVGVEDFSYQTRKKLTSCLINLGLNELIHYSLVNEQTYSIANNIKLVNPLLKDCSNLRSSLLPNLLKTIQENLKNSNAIIEGFEYGHVFSGPNFNQIKEQEYVAGIFGGLKTKLSWSDSSVSIDWFEAKGKIEQLFEKFNFLTYWEICQPRENTNLFHPDCIAEIYLANGTSLGVFGQINPLLAKKLNIPSDLYLFEFNFTVIQNTLKTNKLASYQEYKSYPKIIKDLSFIVHNSISFKELQEKLYSNGSKFLTEINLLDEYRGKSIPENYTSLCLQFIFQSNEKTLKNIEVETVMNNIQSLLTDSFKVNIRM